MSYTSVFGGGTVYTAASTYREVSLTANVVLDWGGDLANTTDVVTDIMDVTASVGSLIIELPDARLVGPGKSILVTNAGANTFLINTSGGASLASVDPGASFHLYLKDNTTAAGTWNVVQFGSVTAGAAASALAGPGLKAVGAQLSQSVPIISFSTNYASGVSDRGSALVWTGGSGTLTLPIPGSVGPDWFAHVKNAGTGVLVVAPASGTIDTGASLTLNPQESFIVITDGAQYLTIGKGVASSFAFTYLPLNLAGSGDYTLSSIEQNKTAYKLTGALTGNRNLIVPTTLQQYWVDNATTGAFILQVKTAAGTGVSILPGQRKILYCDGTNVVDASTAGVSVPIAVSDGGTGATTASAARTNLGATSVGNALFTAASTTTARTALGVTATGDALFTAASAAAARTTLGSTTVGDALFTTANVGAARTTLGLGTAAVVDVGTGVPPSSRTIATSGYLTGGGDLSANRTLALGNMGGVSRLMGSAATAAAIADISLDASLTMTGSTLSVTRALPASSGRYLQALTDDPGSGLSWVGGEVLWSVATVTSAATADITLPDLATYVDVKCFRLEIIDAAPITDGAGLLLQVSYDGVTFSTANYMYSAVYAAGGNTPAAWSQTTASTSAHTDGFLIGTNMSSAASQASQFSLMVNPGINARYPSILGTVTHAIGGGSAFMLTGTVGGQNRTATTPIKKIRLIFTTGNIATLKYHLYAFT